MPIIVLTTRRSRMSWFLMWLISWLMTPSSSSRSMMASNPVVKAMAALFELTPVEKALGEGSSMMYTAGLGIPSTIASAAHQVVQLRVLPVGGTAPET